MPRVSKFMFEYNCKIVDVYDGDSVTTDIDLGFGLWRRGVKLRLYGIDAPELRGETLLKGRASRDYLRGLILGKQVHLKTHKDKTGKYGRYLAVICLPDGTNVNEALVSSGHAQEREY